ncbi:MAG: DUF4836 family protein [Bacteroidaceae bacterium]|nr:DUF4836 family protein [Bacteroidaceae bacterium]
MKKICCIICVVLAVAALCSCSNTDYQKVIPANSPLVVKIDVRSLAEKSDFQKSSVMQKMETGLSAVVSGKDMDKVKEYMSDPMELGFDLSVPAYAFMVDEKTFGITMKVDDDTAVSDLLQLLNRQGLSSKLQEKDGLMCGTLLDDFTYTYDGRTFLLLAAMENGGVNKGKLAQQLMELDEKDGFVSTEGFSRLDNEKADVAVYMKPEVLSKSWMKDLNMEGLLPTAMLKDIEVLTSLNFENGEARLSTKRYARTPEAEKVFDELNGNMKKITGRYLDQVSDDALIWVGAGVKGKWLLSKIKENKELNGLLFAAERAVDAGLMLQAVDGDVSLALSPSKAEENGVEYLLQAQLDNSDFLNDVDDWKQSHKDFGIVMTEKDEHQYLLTLEGQNFQWGVRENDLYWGTVGAVEQEGLSKGTSLQPFKKQIENSTLFIYVDLAALAEKSGAMSNVGTMSQMMGFFYNLKSICYQMLSANEDVIIVEQKSKDKNFLKQILQ